MKSTEAVPASGIDGDAHGDHLAIVHLVAEAAVAQPADRTAHAALGVVLHVTHVREQHGASMVRRGAPQFPFTT